MLLIIKSVLIVALVIIVIQDLKFRAIHVLLPVVLLVVGGMRYVLLGHPYAQLLTTALLLLTILLGLLLYVSIRSKKLTNPIDSSIGLGDIVFFIAVIPLFYSTTYMLFFITGMLFSLVCHFIAGSREKGGIPLAGYLSIYLILLITIDFFTPTDLLLSNTFLI